MNILKNRCWKLTDEGIGQLGFGLGDKLWQLQELGFDFSRYRVEEFIFTLILGVVN